MTVVIHNRNSPDFSFDLQPAAHPGNRLQRFLDKVKRDIQLQSDSHTGQGIQNIVFTRSIEQNLTIDPLGASNAKAGLLPLVGASNAKAGLLPLELNIRGLQVGLLAKPIRNEALFYVWDHVLYNLIIKAMRSIKVKKDDLMVSRS